MDTDISVEALRKQIEWEEACSAKGVAEYVAKQKELADSNKGELTDVTQILLKDRVVKLGQLLQETIEAKLAQPRNEKYSRLVQLSAINYVDGNVVYDYKKVAMIALKVMLQAIFTTTKACTRAALIVRIGDVLEADLKCLLFKSQYPGYYSKIETSLEERNAMSYVQKLRTIQKKFRDFNEDWHDWSTLHKTGVGLIVFEHCMLVMGDVVRIARRKSLKSGSGHMQQYVEMKNEFVEWANSVNVDQGKLTTAKMPLMIPPRDWEEDNLQEGVYYTLDAAKTISLIKKKFNWDRKWINTFVPRQHMSALNALQRTAWKVNMPVLKVQNYIFRNSLGGMPEIKEHLKASFPEHLNKDKSLYTADDKKDFSIWRKQMAEYYTEERTRRGQIVAYSSIHKLALEVRDWEEMYFGYTACFRGRVYCLTSNLSPQGCDVGRGLLTFARPEVVTEDGLKWMALSMTSKFGVDNRSIEDRVKWVYDNEDLIREVSERPVDARALWLDADKPFQFLASCMEWSKTQYGKDANALVSLPVGIDGKCNGLQHYSALLRDEFGAKETNLVYCIDPADIYATVARVAAHEVSVQGTQLAQEWMAITINRKCAKRPVMTLPYGATQYSARSYIKEYLHDNVMHLMDCNIASDPAHIRELAVYLTPIIWSSIKKVVKSAIVGKSWIQRNGKAVVARDGCMKFVTPIGFPVYQAYMTDDRVEVRSEVLGSVRVYVRQANKSPNLNRHNNGMAPNFTHSMDSTHMVKIINRMAALGNVPLAMIHDEYGTHPRYMNDMSKFAVEEFYDLYKDDVLAQWREQLQIEEELPPYGTYDIKEILKANNAFI